jgi:toxin secretion/phage lysis holin
VASPDWLMGKELLLALLWLMAIDVATGVLAAIKERKLNSTIGREGLVQKVGTLLGIAACVVLETYVPHFQGARILGLGIADGFTLAFVLIETTSILENLGRAGVKVPRSIRRVLAKVPD